MTLKTGNWKLETWKSKIGNRKSARSESACKFSTSSSGTRILAAVFCVGLYSLLAQVLALRELLVVFFGNELTFGAILGFWLIGISLGSLTVYKCLKRLAASRLNGLVTVLLAALAFLLPVQVIVIRQLRAILHVPFGEYVSFGGMLISTGAILLPVCLIIGALFPCACQLAEEQDRHAVSRVYAFEALGSMASGVLFTFLLVRILPPFSIAALAGSCTLIGAALLASAPRVRRCLLAAALCMAVAGLCPGCLAGMERAGIQARWRAFGYLPVPGESWSARLLCSVDSPYQNLALIETEGQKTLYGNAQVMFVFPDPITGEHNIHFIMGQNPQAKAVLLMGGDPATDISELLKYPLSRLVHVELDQEIGRILDAEAGPAYRKAIQDPRFKEYPLDGPRFVKTCREHFDVVLVMAPSPTTVALNRFYTLEFFRDIERILAPDGFIYTSVEASPQLQDECASLSASIYQSLAEVFDRVLVTAGTRNRFFAGTAGSPLTFDREILFQRSSAAHLSNDYFRPEYFLNADDISPEKIEFVRNRLAEMRVPANTSLKPISTFYSLTLWSRFSGSHLEPFLNKLRRIRSDWTCWTVIGAGAVFLVIGGLLRVRQRRLSPAALSGMNRGWFRSMIGFAITSTGCCEMALEIILIFVFQNLFGYVYARIGLIVAMYMLGLMLGALSATRMTTPRGAWPCMLGLELVILCVALVIPALMTRFSHSAMLSGSGVMVETAIYGLVTLAGWAGGAHFPLGNHILREAGGRAGPTAAIANAADLFGSAVGGFAVGVFLLPLVGIGASCMMLAALKGGSLLCVLSARLVRPAHIPDQIPH